MKDEMRSTRPKSIGYLLHSKPVPGALTELDRLQQRSRMSSPMRFLVADGDDERTIQLQRLNSGSAGWGAPDESRSVPQEVIVPQVCSGLKQATLDAGFRIDEELTGSLVQ